MMILYKYRSFLESGHRIDRCLGILEDAMCLHFRWTPALNLVLLVMQIVITKKNPSDHEKKFANKKYLE